MKRNQEGNEIYNGKSSEPDTELIDISLQDDDKFDIESEDNPFLNPDDYELPEEEVIYTDEPYNDDPLVEISNRGMQSLPSIPAFVEDTKRQIERDVQSLPHKDTSDDYQWSLLDVIEGAVYILIGAAQGSATTFDLLKKHTRDCLLDYGFDERNIDIAIENGRNTYISQQPVDKDIMDYVLRVSRDVSYQDKVSVLPLMCGTGKSTAITRLIIETVKKVESAKSLKNKAKEDGQHFNRELYNGLLVVTDSKERLKSLWSTNDHRASKDNEFITSHADGWVTVMTDENSQDAETEQKKTPVLLITTQRYFTWTPDEIKAHLTWGKDYRRPLIIFDEMPYLNEVCDISVKTLNDIDTALWLGLDNDVKPKDKLWCIRQWEKFRDRFTKRLLEFERNYHIQKFFYEPDIKAITDDDDRFITLIEENKGGIRKNYSKEYHDIFAIRKLMNSWGIFSHRNADTGAYENKITVYLDNREKMTNLNAKIIILDGTGNVSPIYDGQEDYIHIHNGVNFLRPLSYLTIKLGDYGTSRYDFYNDRNRIAPHIKQFLKEDGNKLDEMYYFTYKNKRSKFGDTKHTAYFGDIKGKNEFNSAVTITQVGLNSLQPPQYLAHVLARDAETREALMGKSHAETEERLNQIIKGAKYNSFKYRHILADIDQCLFRSAIRNSNNTKDITYYLFYSKAFNRLLTELIKERYRIELKAEVIPICKDTIEAAWAKQSDASYAKISNWINEGWDGTPIKKKKVLEQLGLLESTFDSTVRRHFKEEFKQFKANARELGCPGGYYAKVVQKEVL